MQGVRRSHVSFLVLALLVLAGLGLAVSSHGGAIQPERAGANAPPTIGLGQIAAGGFTAVYDVTIGRTIETTLVNSVYCLARLDENKAGTAVTGTLVCYADVEARSLLSPSAIYLAQMDGVFGPPPPPPYAPARGKAVGAIVGSQITAKMCVELDSLAIYLTVDINKITLTGYADIYLGPYVGGQDPDDCRNELPQGAALVMDVSLTPRVDNDPTPGSPLDWDNDGCLDVDELRPDPFAGTWRGFDPYNPYDCDSDFNSIFFIESTLVSQTVCKGGQPVGTCTGQPNGTQVPGAYLYCVADIQDVPTNPLIRPFCYLDWPDMVVNPAAVPVAYGPVGTVLTCTPAPPEYCSDGFFLPEPPPPYRAVPTDPSNAELTGSFASGVVTAEGCFRISNTQEAYMRATFYGTGQGTLDLWHNFTGGADPCSSPPAPASPETGSQCDNAIDENSLDTAAVGHEDDDGDAVHNEPVDDGDGGKVNDGCPQVGTIAEAGAQCVNNTDNDAGDAAETAAGRKRNDGCSSQGPNAPNIVSAVIRAVEQGPNMDTDRDGCPDRSELSGSESLGGRRDPLNRYDYFNPSKDGLNRVDDILIVVRQYFIDDPVGSPDLNSQTDRTAIPGSNLWNLGPPNGQQRVDDILAIVKQYFHDCAPHYVTVSKPPWSEIETPELP